MVIKLIPNTTIVTSENGIVGLHDKDSLNKHRYYNNYPNSTLIDLSGKYIVPGLIDMHAHVAGVLEKLFQPNKLRRDTPKALAYGITTIRNPGGPTEYLWD